MPEIVIKIIVCLIASFFAGIGTGFVGMSAAVAITPLLMGFLNISHFHATAIGLGSDILASLIACITYFKNKNVDIKNTILLLVSVLVFCLLGTIAGYYMPSNVMGIGMIASVSLMGLKLLIFPSSKYKKNANELSKTKKNVISILFGSLIGFICGFVGAGGGMLLLLCLTVFLRFDMHKAVGTSLFIMTFAAFIGAGFHILFEGVIVADVNSNIADMDFVAFGLCVGFTFIFSLIGSRLANKMSEFKLNLISGIMLELIALTVAIVTIVK